MSVLDTAREIDEQAAVWAARLDGSELDTEQTERLETWLAAGARRAGALLKAQAALSLLDRGRALSGVIPQPTARRVRSSRRRFLAASGLGALAAGVGGIAFLVSSSRHYATEIGEVRRVPLADGSVVAINTGSTLVVDMKTLIRDIHLTRGEAWFQVAKDAKRPFVVAAGRVRVRAVGTAFSVRRREGGTDVLVTEGTVETWVVGEEKLKAKLAAGSKVFITDYELTKPIQVAAATIDRTLAWRDGQIALEGETLADAVAEFNRYNERKLVIDDTALGQEKLVGQFRTTEPRAFAQAVVSTLGARISEDATTIRIVRAGALIR